MENKITPEQELINHISSMRETMKHINRLLTEIKPKKDNQIKLIERIEELESGPRTFGSEYLYRDEFNENFLSIKIEDEKFIGHYYGLSVRADRLLEILKEKNVKTFGELYNYRFFRLKRIHGFGKKTFRELAAYFVDRSKLYESIR